MTTPELETLDAKDGPRIAFRSWRAARPSRGSVVAVPGVNSLGGDTAAKARAPGLEAMPPGPAGRLTRLGRADRGRRSLLQARFLPIAALWLAGMVVTAGPVRSAPSETLAPLLQQPILNLPGKALTAINVAFPPGAVSTPHRHGDAFLYAYVLEGAVRSRIEGQPAHVYRTGESWTEMPGDHHVLTENVSSTETARLLVVFLADTGASLKTDDPRKEP